MAIKYLLDTNIFLEILLDQDKRNDCEKFLTNNIGQIAISDFSLHSIGVILFRGKKEDVFQQFIDDVLFNIVVLSLPENMLDEVIKNRKMYKFDFDDAYQYSIANNYRLKIITLDSDFKVLNQSEVSFL